MTNIASAHVASSASPTAFFDRWADVGTWPEWNADTEWVRLDGESAEFIEGATGVLKPKGGPKVKFVVEKLVPSREFVDVSRLAGARLTFRHLVVPLDDGGCTVDVSVTLDGPLGWVWNRILGNGIAKSLQPDLDSLAAVAEAKTAR